ncbi:sideroflexin-4 isoform X2 [Carettochelys insculpta]|uniref:sideroflexin-4 isoform X2 n=1 Tax=Carettochelys insculpta TaxID=44489 RepID=UPI003EBD7C7F
MDLNVQFWRTQSQSFFQRLIHWADILDPTLLLKSKKEIEDARLLLETSALPLEDPLQNKQVKQAWLLSLSSVNSHSGEIIPIVFRPPAFLPIVTPLAFANLLQHRQPKSTFFCQFLFHSYTVGFTIANGNLTAKTEETSYTTKELFLSIGAVTYSALVGSLPHYLMKYQRINPSQHSFFRRLLPISLLAGLSGINVIFARANEFEKGIEVMDKDGKVVGMSEKAGMKAVRETALSRAALFGIAMVVPEFLLYFMQRKKIFLRHEYYLTPMRLVMVFGLLGMFLPVSFSVFPQWGTGDV